MRGAEGGTVPQFKTAPHQGAPMSAVLQKAVWGKHSQGQTSCLLTFQPARAYSECCISSWFLQGLVIFPSTIVVRGLFEVPALEVGKHQHSVQPLTTSFALRFLISGRQKGRQTTWDAYSPDCSLWIIPWGSITLRGYTGHLRSKGDGQEDYFYTCSRIHKYPLKELSWCHL